MIIQDWMTYYMCDIDYKNDPYSEGNPMNAICSRGDLQEKPSTSGCVDTKVSVVSMSSLPISLCLIHLLILIIVLSSINSTIIILIMTLPTCS